MPAYKRGKAWCARFEVNGQKFSKSLGPVSTKADAIAYESKVRAEILSGTLGTSKSAYTVDQAVLRHLQEARLISIKSLESQARNIAEHINGVPLTSIIDSVEAVIKSCREKGLATSTINKRIALLRRVANLAHDKWGWLEKDLGEKIKTLDGEVKRTVFLTPDEVERLATCCTHPTVAKAIRIYARTGLREHELLSANEIINGCVVAVSYKGKKAERRTRLVPLPADVPDIKIPIGITYNTLRHYFEKARLEAGLPHVRVHDLRHTFASWLAQSGANLVVIRDLLGHTTFSETTRYTHLQTDDLKKASSNVTKFIASNCTKSARKRPSA